jgi:hypothetical protein
MVIRLCVVLVKLVLTAGIVILQNRPITLPGLFKGKAISTRDTVYTLRCNFLIMTARKFSTCTSPYLA